MSGTYFLIGLGIALMLLVVYLGAAHKTVTADEENRPVSGSESGGSGVPGENADSSRS